MGDPSRRGGFVLVLVVALLLGLSLLGHGALLLARFDHAVARAGERLLQAAAEASRGMEAAGRVPASPGAVGTTVQVASEAGPGGSYRALRRSLDREWFLLEAEGRDPSGSAARRLVRPGWSLDPAARVASRSGVVEVALGAAVEVYGTVDGGAVRRLPGGTAGARCHSWSAVLDSLGVGSLPGVASVPLDPAGREALGLLGLDTLEARLPLLTGAWGTPSPLERMASCVDDPWNWGDPSSPGGACRERWVARADPGSLEVVGGVGQGLLMVRGDLVLSGDVRFRGLVLVGGRLTVADSGRIEGLVRAAGGIRVSAGARVEGSACAAVLALDAARGALGMSVYPEGGPWWVP